MQPAMPLSLMEPVFPESTNHYGTLFAGCALSWMAKAAYLAASRHAQASVVMGRVLQVEFLSPAHVGEVVELTAQVTRVGNRSLTVTVSGRSASPMGGPSTAVLSGQFDMVVVTDAGLAPAVHAQSYQEGNGA